MDKQYIYSYIIILAHWDTKVHVTNYSMTLYLQGNHTFKCYKYPASYVQILGVHFINVWFRSCSGTQSCNRVCGLNLNLINMSAVSLTGDILWQRHHTHTTSA